MKFKYFFLLSTIFIFLFSFLSSVSAIDVNQIMDNMYISGIESGACNSLNETWSDADYYCIRIVVDGIEYYDCADVGDPGTLYKLWKPGYFNISFGYQDIGGGTMVDSLCIYHNYLLSPDWYPYQSGPVEIEGWEINEGMISQIIFLGWGNDTDYLPPVMPDLHPTELGNFYDYDMGSDGSIGFYANSRFSNWDWIELDWYDTVTLQSGTISRSKFLNDPTQICVGDTAPSQVSMVFCLESLGDDVYFNSYSLGNNATIVFDMYAYNEYGWSWGTFNLTTSSNDSTPSVPTYDDYDEGTGTSFIAYLSQLFRAVFPVSTSLSSTSRYTYVLITAILINLGFAFLYYGATGGNPKFIGVFLAILNILMLFYFFAISYLPISLLVVFVLLLLALAFFKVKAGG